MISTPNIVAVSFPGPIKVSKKCSVFRGKMLSNEPALNNALVELYGHLVFSFIDPFAASVRCPQ